MTLKDIAGMAGVSVATVSHVLNHRDNKVSPEVAARIRSIIKEVNYQPNTVAKALRSSKSSIIGVMTEDLSVWQTGSIVQGVTHYAQQNGYSVILSDLGLKDKIKTDYDSIYKYRGVISKVTAEIAGCSCRWCDFCWNARSRCEGINRDRYSTCICILYNRECR